MTLPGRADVVVVGAGLAGLAAAVQLQEAGLDVAVVERSDGVGGRVRTDLVDGFRLDRGFQLFNPAYPEARRVLDLAALDLRPFAAGVVACSARGRHTLGDPRRQPRAALGSLTAPVGSLRQKAAFAAWMARLGALPARSLRSAGDRALVDELARRGLGGDLTERLLRPFLSGVLADEDLSSSQRMASMLLRSFVRGTPSVPALGMQALPDQLVARLRPGTVHLGVDVTSVGAGGVDTEAGRLTAPAVVCAVDGVSATRLGLPGTTMRPLTTWWWAADEPPADDAFLRVDSDRRGPLANTVVMTAAAPSYAGDGRALVGATAVTDVDDEQAARAHAGLLYGVDASRWQLLRTDVIEHALPAHPAGQPLRQPVAVGDGLFVCGDHRDTPSIQGALVSGRRTAQAVLSGREARTRPV